MPNTPMVAVFDTAFHGTMPEEAYIYALPYELYQKHYKESPLQRKFSPQRAS